jgi:Cu2+-exporting ATPase
MEDHTQHHNHHTVPARETPDGTGGMMHQEAAVATAPGDHDHHTGHGAPDDHVVHTDGQHAGHSTAMFKDSSG